MAGEIKTLEFSEGVSVSSPFDAGSGSGTGEVNFVANNNGAADLDQSQTDDVGDWIDSGTGTTSSITTSSGEIPRFPFQETAIKITNDGSGTAYTQIRFRVPPADRGKKLKIEFAQKPDGSIYQTGDFDLELYNYSDNYSTGETQVSIIGADNGLPNQTGTSYFEFDADDREYYELRFVRSAGSAGGFIAINDFVVGPGKLHSGAVVTAWNLSWAVTIADFGNNDGLSGFTLDEAGYRRVGDSYEAFVGGSVVGTGTNAGDFRLPIPNGHTGNASPTSVIGHGFAVLANGTKQNVSVVINTGGFPVLRIDDNGATAITSVTGNHIGDTTATDIETFFVRYTITASEIEGSGVLNTITQDNLTEWSAIDATSLFNETGGSFDAVGDTIMRRVGDSMEIIVGRLRSNAASGSGAIEFTIPNGLTIASIARDTNQSRLGDGWWFDSSLSTVGNVQISASSSTALRFAIDNGTGFDTLEWSEFQDNDVLYFKVTVPISEWAGSQSSLVGFTQASSTQSGLLPRYQKTTVALDNDFSSGNVILERIGNTVTATFDSVANHSSSSAPSTSAGLIPSDFRPVSSTRTAYMLTASVNRAIEITAGGQISLVYYDWAGSLSAQTNVSRAPTITYTVGD